MLCPDCPPVHQAHELVLANLWPNLGFALLPFVVIAAVIAGFQRALARRHL